MVIAHGTRDDVARSKAILSNAALHDGQPQNCCAR